MNRIQIGNKWIGEDDPAFIVAEVSANHNHSLARAIEILHAAQAAGADAVKLQTYTPETLTIDSSGPWFQLSADGPWAGKNLYQLYGEAYTPWEWHPELQAVARKLGLEWFSTPFDATAVDFLETLAVPVYKVASFELINLPLLRKIARTRKPVLAATGMATLGEIEEAVTALRAGGTTQIVLLKCTSAYPASPAELNLRTLPHLAQAFGVFTGLSDHTLGSAVAAAAVTLGARVIEKHLTLCRADGGPDASFSLEPAEFRRLVQEVRTVEQALGKISYGRTPEEEKSLVFRRSLFVVRDLKQGGRFTADNVRSIRPGQGLHPRHLEQILGRTAACDIPRGTPLNWDLVG